MLDRSLDSDPIRHIQNETVSISPRSLVDGRAGRRGYSRSLSTSLRLRTVHRDQLGKFAERAQHASSTDPSRGSMQRHLHLL